MLSEGSWHYEKGWHLEFAFPFVRMPCFANAQAQIGSQEAILVDNEVDELSTY